MTLHGGAWFDGKDRRARLEARDDLHGIECVEVETEPGPDNQRVLRVLFQAKGNPAGAADLRQMVEELEDRTDKVRVLGGDRVQGIGVQEVQPEGDRLRVRVSERGDFGAYILEIDHPRLDPAYARQAFSFKAGCEADLDCRPEGACPTPALPEPAIDYMAKDFASFRQALLDRLSLTMPSWRERNAADLGITLVELLAYVADRLSYEQDAIANEAFLSSARHRISVRRHARLIDHAMHDGVSARAAVHVTAARAGRIPQGTQFLTRIDEPLKAMRPPHPAVLPADVAAEAATRAQAVFEAIADTDVHPALNELAVHDWGSSACGLPEGATSFHLVGDHRPHLKAGAFLLLEEVKGVRDGTAGEADPFRRQLVRVVKVEPDEDVLPEDPAQPPLALTRVTLHPADALRHPFCVRAPVPGHGNVAGMTVARGNIVLADHGRRVAEKSHRGPAPPTPGMPRRAHRIELKERGLSQRIPLPADGPGDAGVAPARALFQMRPGEAEAQSWPRIVAPGGAGAPWRPLRDLTGCRPFHTNHVAEVDDGGRAILRFGDGECGAALPVDAPMEVDYRVGVGEAGNVGADALVHVVAPDPLPPDWPLVGAAPDGRPVAVRNPLPAWGGTEPESVESVRRLAPAALHAETHRAVTEEDYARAAERHPDVERAVATFRWTGSWHTVSLAIDPRGRRRLSAEEEDGLRAWVEGFTQAGYDLEIDGPTYVPLEVELKVCVGSEHFRSDVERALREALGSGSRADGPPGFFHPASWTFGQPLHLSRLYQAIEAVEGVDSAVVTVFQRLDRDAAGELEAGRVAAGRLEILELANDPNHPDRGTLRLHMRGGK